MHRLIELCSVRQLTGLMLVSIVICLGVLPRAAAQWVQVNDELKVMNETFTGASLSSGWKVGGANYTPSLTAATNLDPAGSGWLRLTSAGTQQATYAYNSESFTAENATIAAKFKYAAYGGNGADGITFFLADASKTFGVGAYGGSLGYAQKTLTGGGEANMVGMNGGYIGLGIDEFGNYSNPTEGRIGGEGFQPGNISIRGPGNGYTGYEYLGGTGQLTTPIAFGSTTRPSGTDERTFQIVITATNQLTVYMQAGDTAPMQALYSIDLSGYARPEDLVLGFTGSTGGQTNIHEIQGLMLTSQVARLWDNSSGDSTWSGATNWDGTAGKTPAVGADILLDNHYVGTAQTINVGTGATRSIRSLQIDAPFAYTLTNGTIEFNDRGVLGPSGVFVSQGNGAANHTVNSAITLGNAIDISNSSSGTLTLSGPLSTNGYAVTLTGAGNTQLSGTVSGAGSMLKLGSGTVTMSGNNTYSGGTKLAAGTLAVGHNNALGSGALTINAGTLTSAAPTPNTIGNNIVLAGNASFTNINTAGTLTQSGADRTLNLYNATQSGTVNISNDNTARTLTIGVDSGSATISGIIQNGGNGAGSLTKTGQGTLVLTNQNTFSGNLNLNAGEVRLGSSNRLADNLTVNFNSGALNLADSSERVGDITIGTGGGMIDFGTGDGANYFLFNSIAATPSGVLTVANWESGTDTIASSTGLTQAALDSFYFVGSGSGATQLAQQSVTGYSGLWRPITAPSTTTGWTTWDSGAGSNRWSRGNNWNPNLANNWVSDNRTKVAFGSGSQRTVDLEGNRIINAMRFDPGSLSFNIGNGQWDTLTFDGPNAASVAFIQQASSSAQSLTMRTVELSANTVVDMIGSGNLTISSNLIGSANLVKENTGGKLILSGASTSYTGNIFVNAGILQITSGGALGATSGTTTIADGATLELTGGINTAENITLRGTGAVDPVTGPIGAIHSLSGTNTLSGVLGLSDAATLKVSSGTLNVSREITSTLNRNLVLAGNASTNLNVTGQITTGTGGVTIDTGGTVTFGGSGSNTFTGITRINAGTLVLDKTVGTTTTDAIAGDIALGDGTGNGSSAILKLNKSDQIADSSALTIARDGIFDLNGQAERIGALSGTAESIIDNKNTTAAATLIVGDTSSTTFAGSIKDTGANLALEKRGTGKLTLSGANSYAGGTTLTSGIIAIQNSTALGSGALLVRSGANLEVAGNLTVANAMTLNGPGTLANDGAIQNTSGNNTLSGAITLGSASRIMADTDTALTLSGNIGGSGQALTVGGSGNTRINGILGTGTGTLTKDGSGVLTLGGTSANTFSGATTVNSGTLVLTKSSNTVAVGGALLIGSGDSDSAVVRLDAADQIVNSSAVTIGSNGLLNLNNYSETIGSLAGSGVVSLGSGTLTTGSAGSTVYTGSINGDGSLTKAGNGVFTLAGTSTYTGATSINAGTLRVGANNALAASSNVTLAGGATLDINGYAAQVGSIASGSTSSSISLGSGVLTTGGSGASTTFAGIISGSGSLAKVGTGTLVLSGTNTYTGGTVIAGGTLKISGDRNLGAVPTGSDADNITLNGGTLATSQSMTLNSRRGVTLGDQGGTLQIADASTFNFSSTITGPGELTLALGGSGVFNLTSNLAFGGTLNLSGGTLRLTDAIFEVGVFHITGNTILDFAGSSSTLDIGHLIIDRDVNVTVINWQNGSDFLLAHTWQGATINTRGEPEETKVVFDPGVPGPPDTGSGNNTAWLPYDGSTGQITPVPEPSTYGAILLGLCVAAVGWRRWRSQAQR